MLTIERLKKASSFATLQISIQFPKANEGYESPGIYKPLDKSLQLIDLPFPLTQSQRPLAFGLSIQLDTKYIPSQGTSSELARIPMLPRSFSSMSSPTERRDRLVEKAVLHAIRRKVFQAYARTTVKVLNTKVSFPCQARTSLQKPSTVRFQKKNPRYNAADQVLLLDKSCEC